MLSGVLTVKAKYLFPSLIAIWGPWLHYLSFALLKVLLLQLLSEKKLGILVTFAEYLVI